MRLLVIAFALVACSKSEPQPATTAPPPPSFKSLDSLPLKDLVGFVSGAYHSGGNNPAIYADLDRKVFVLMGEHAITELPMATKPAEAAAVFEAFLVAHGYPANGKQPTDEHARVMVDGKEMVLVTTDELLPTMPADLKARFTTEQYDLLYKATSARDGFKRVGATVPVMWCYTKSIVVLGPHMSEQEFPISSANDAFAAFQRML